MQAGDGYDWTLFGVVEAPFALLLGSLNALGGASSASYCSRYTLSARQLMLEASPYFAAGTPLDGFQQYHDAIAYVDNIGFSCYNAFASEINADHFQDLVSNWYAVPVNLLYNFGYMWIDVVNYIFYNPTTVP